MHELVERVLEPIRRQELLRAGDRVGVAVSGGIDSVALLRLLLELRSELGIVVSVVHFNHGLRGAESAADQEFVAELARGHGLEFFVAGGDVAQLAAQEGSGVEAAARELRYEFFRGLLGSGENVRDLSTSGAEAQNLQASYRSAGSAAPPHSEDHSRIDLDKIATGHTLDDQAETLLMRVIRGTVLRGLGGIYPRILVEREDEEDHGEIVRPLLGIRRRELERDLVEIKQPWREDLSNADSRFTRNRVRRLVLPLLEREFNPAVVENLAELAEIARDEEDYWENEISGWLGTVVQWSQPEWTRGLPGFEGAPALVQIQLPNPSNPSSANEFEDTQGISPRGVAETPRGASGDTGGQGVLRSAQDDSDLLEQPGPAIMNASVSRPWLLTEPRAVQRRVVKAIGDEAGIPLEFKHIEEILRFAAEDGPPGKELSLPLGWKIRREPEAMVFLTPDLRRQERISDYEYGLAVPGRVVVAELGVVFEALQVVREDGSEIAPEAEIAEYNPQGLLRAELLRRRLVVRNWRPGDRFWPAHTKAPKKIKELLQERHVAQPERRLWPVIVSGEEIVWMRGFPVPARLRAEAGQQAVLVREMPGGGAVW